MIDATIPFHLSAADLPNLKKAEALHLPSIAPSLRPELIARTFGFHTATGFRQTLQAAPDREHDIKLSFQTAADFARSRELVVSARNIYDILATTVNSRGEAADLGDAPGANRFDSINSRGAPGFAVNEFNLRLQVDIQILVAQGIAQAAFQAVLAGDVFAIAWCVGHHTAAGA